ncbi:MAG: PQQ-binding-like beta-propeller repeat protein [Candidatus Bathyarchaeia archaeon]
MQIFSKHKKQIVTATLLLTLTVSVLAALPVNAHTPPWSIPTYAYVAAAPDPVGVNQPVAIVFWTDKVPSTAAGSGGDRWRDLTVDISKPDGTKETLGPFVSDPVGGGYALFTPDQVGQYTIQFNFPKQVLSLFGPAGTPGAPSDFINDTFLATTATTTLTVQQEQIDPIPDYPLPTGFWTRPIEGQNTAWGSIASNWLGGTFNFMGNNAPTNMPKEKYNVGSAPDSAHIMWTKQYSFGGVAGGPNTGVAGNTFYSGLMYETYFTNPIILQGRLYYPLTESDNPTNEGYACVDLITGEEIYQSDTLAPNFGQLYDYESMNQHGVIPNGFLWVTTTDPNNGGAVWIAYDPIDGSWLFNLTNVPTGFNTLGSQGQILIYQLDPTAGWLALWDNTAAQGLTGATDSTDTTSSNYYQWRPVGKNVNASQAYLWNITIPKMLPTAAVITAYPGDILLGRSSAFGGMSSFGTPNPYTLWAISLKEDSLGQVLWQKDYPAPENNITRVVGPVDPTNRVFTMYDKETMQYWGYSLDTGEYAWGPTPSEEAWNYYSGPSGTVGALGEGTYVIAYGRLYTTGYGGAFYCYDTKNGDLLWTYKSNSGLDTPYGGFPSQIGAIAEGKIYTQVFEHSADAPPFKGAPVNCIDAYTGDLLWTMSGWASDRAMAVADGYLVYLNLYDMQIYCVGMGTSATTVTTPDVAIPLGTTAVIKGAVTDQTPASKDTPAISDADMGKWMEYLHMQKPMPDNVVGVPVTLTATDESGTVYPLGSVTTNYGGTYATSWTPPAEGKYLITAKFDTTASYGESYATTYLIVGAASPSAVVNPTVPPTNAPVPPSSGTPTTTYIAVGAAIVIIIAAIAALFLRKRK